VPHQYSAKVAHGDCEVPQQYSVNPQLGIWVKTQRQMKRKGPLGHGREAQLNSFGFEWRKEEEVPQVAWKQRFQQLVEYKQNHGDCKVLPQYGQLGWWVETQRQMRRKGPLGDKREAQLDAIGFKWGKQGISKSIVKALPTPYRNQKPTNTSNSKGGRTKQTRAAAASASHGSVKSEEPFDTTRLPSEYKDVDGETSADKYLQNMWDC
jgi:hypothetical protein